MAQYTQTRFKTVARKRLDVVLTSSPSLEGALKVLVMRTYLPDRSAMAEGNNLSSKHLV